MGWFSRTGSKRRVPRWGFDAGWEDFVATLENEAGAFELVVDEAGLAAGAIALPAGAGSESWDLRGLSERCRDLEPHEWRGEIRESLRHAFGRGPTRAPARPRAGSAPSPQAGPVELPPANEFRRGLRVQVFGRGYVETHRLAVDRVAMRPFGDAWLVIVQDLVAAERTVTWQQLAEDGITREQAFELGLQLAVSDSAPGLHSQTLRTHGATADLAVANSFYLGAVMLRAQAMLPADTAVVACAVSWHHWMLATLERGIATRATLRALAELVANLSANIEVTAAETIGTTLWWWPVGDEPTPFTADGELPPALAALLAPG